MKHAWPTSSCHGALHTVLMALGIGPGDEVIVPDITWIGSVSPAVWLGAKPVFADVLRHLVHRSCLYRERITDRTKAIVVHL